MYGCTYWVSYVDSYIMVARVAGQAGDMCIRG